MNQLYYGDNLDVLRRHVPDESVDLVYLDPPFKSNQDYNVLFAEQDGARAAAQIKAFEDTWRWDQAAAKAFEEVVLGGGRPAEAMSAFVAFLGPSDMLAYLSMMAPRLIELRRVLKPSGSIYLHCDPTASHYLKMLMDAVFGPGSFINEIVWHYRKWPSGKFTFQRNHDILLFYAARPGQQGRVFNQLYMERAASTLKRFGKAKIVSGHDAEGKRLPSQVETEESEGVRQDDAWDIGRVPPIKQLFPTEKPAALLERVLAASSNPGDVVLDPFCGCGTTVIAAQAMNRRWIGIDITHLAINLIRYRLRDAYGPSIKETYAVIGEPVSTEDAEQLAGEDPFQFQAWALGLVGARPAEIKKGADRGVDGILYFLDEPVGGKVKQIVISVKAGHTGPHHVQELRGVVEGKQAAVGVLISMQKPTKAMREEAASAGFYRSEHWGKDYPRIQLLTVADLLAGKDIDYPPAEKLTFKRAPRAEGRDETAELPLT